MQDFGTFSSFLSPTDLIPIRGMPTFIRDRGIFYTGNPNNEGPIEGGFDVWEAFVEAIVPVVQGGRQRRGPAHRRALCGLRRQRRRLGRQVRRRLAGQRGGSVPGNLVARHARGLAVRAVRHADGRHATSPIRCCRTSPPYIAATTIGGNPQISPEISDTITLGVVFQPQRAEGLSFSMDVYDIEIQDAISQLGGVQIVDRCYLRGVTELCSLIRRSEVGTPYINQIYNLFINVAETHTAGVDFEASYNRSGRLVRGRRANGSACASSRTISTRRARRSSANSNSTVSGETSTLYDYPGGSRTSHSPTARPVHVQPSDSLPQRDGARRDLDRRHRYRGNSVGSRAYTNINFAYDFDWTNNRPRCTSTSATCSTRLRRSFRAASARRRATPATAT